MPTANSGIAATGIFVFISVWNEFLFALVLTHREAKTVTVRLAEVQTEIFGGRDYGMAAAAGVLTVLPVTLSVILLYRFIARSLTEGAIKG